MCLVPEGEIPCEGRRQCSAHQYTARHKKAIGNVGAGDCMQRRLRARVPCSCPQVRARGPGPGPRSWDPGPGPWAQDLAGHIFKDYLVCFWPISNFQSYGEKTKMQQTETGRGGNPHQKITGRRPNLI